MHNCLIRKRLVPVTLRVVCLFAVHDLQSYGLDNVSSLRELISEFSIDIGRDKRSTSCAHVDNLSYITVASEENNNIIARRNKIILFKIVVEFIMQCICAFKKIPLPFC